MVKGLGLRLENLRDKSEYSQKEISSILGFSDNTYGQYEREERTPAVGTLIELANLYNVSLDYLLRGKEYKVNENNLTKDIAVKEVLDALKKHETNDPYVLRPKEEIYEEFANNLTSFITINEVLAVFKKHEINDPYILQAKQWTRLSRDDLISLTRHFEWTVFQTDSDK